MTRRSFSWTVAALALILAGFAPVREAAAHPGGLNAEGCHNNRKTGEYHCHRGGGAPQRLTGPDGGGGCGVQGGRCRGCGCKGGPGYRSHRTGKCVGFKQLHSECGDPPTLRCAFENAPGSGANRACALGLE